MGMMKKKLIIVSSIILLIICTIVLINPFKTKPFAKIKAEDIESVELFLIPPNRTISVTDHTAIAMLTEILKEIELYQEDDSGRDYNGQLVQFTIVLKNGETHRIGAYNPFLFLNDKCYRTKYGPCEKLNALGNQLFNEYER